MNKAILVGRLVRDADIRYTQGGDSTCVARYTVAVDRRRRSDADDGQPTADFISCVAFGKRAEFLERFGKKGVKFIVEGRIQTGSYEKDGQRIYTTDIFTENIEFAESKNNSSGGAPAPSADENGFMQIPDSIDEELPFA